MQRWIIVAAIALATSGQACAQPLGYYDTPDTTLLRAASLLSASADRFCSVVVYPAACRPA
jgi:hypothetical protein